ncbi:MULTISPECIES: hypothetical protein [Streptomycetaceae]|uniref:hypothetical protein n=1 Tax=Streptomycetaceae TaxID=2062 RepID=UPI00093B8D26|nr:hypothetical protein [Streptomyces sp. CB02056]OKI05493.1 hypothetical protein AMK13_19115 [Streptomyces sp. CB02056]
MTTTRTAAELFLLLAVTRQASLTLADCRTIARRYPGGRAYCPGRGWTAPAELAVRRRLALNVLTGGVLIDNLAYNAVQAAAGNRDFPAWPSLGALSAMLTRPSLRRLCRAAALATATTEVTLGLAALGLLPAPAALTLAVLVHGAFLLISPRRIVPFSMASLGLLLLATTHPLLPT